MIGGGENMCSKWDDRIKINGKGCNTRTDDNKASKKICKLDFLKCMLLMQGALGIIIRGRKCI